jgi:hypothetical protein
MFLFIHILLLLAGPSSAQAQLATDLLPGMACRAPNRDPNFCQIRKQVVDALSRSDLERAELMLPSNSARNILNAATLGVPIVSGSVPTFLFMIERGADINAPSNFSALQNIFAISPDQKDGNHELGLDFSGSEFSLPPLLLTVVFSRNVMLGSLVSRAGRIDLDATDTLGNNVWHYIAYFGRTQQAAMMPLTPSRFQRNQRGLTPLDILERSPHGSEDEKNRIRLRINNTHF